MENEQQLANDVKARAIDVVTTIRREAGVPWESEILLDTVLKFMEAGNGSLVTMAFSLGNIPITSIGWPYQAYLALSPALASVELLRTGNLAAAQEKVKAAENCLLFAHQTRDSVAQAKAVK